MRFRGKSIRRKIVALLLVPLVALTSIWVFAAVTTGRETNRLLAVASVVRDVGGPARDAVRAVQDERRQALVRLAAPHRSEALDLLHRRQRATDEAVADLRAAARGAAGAVERAGAGSGARLDALLAGFGRLGAVREQVEEATAARREAYEAYSGVVDSFHVFMDGLHGADGSRHAREGRALVGLSRAREFLARQDALMAAAFAAGRMTGQELRAFSDRAAERELSHGVNLPLLPAGDRRVYEAYWSGPEGRALRTAEDRIIGAGAARAAEAVDPRHWRETAGTALAGLRAAGREVAERHHERADLERSSVLLRAGAAGGLGFVAVLVSVAVSFRVGRGLVRDLSALRKEANEAADVRLPAVMRRLAAGEEVDVGTEVPRLEYGRDEMGQVGQALNTLQRAAVEAAVNQADMRRGVSEVFVNLARRNQVLLHRQLTLLDAMERRTEDAEELADLFRLDHLTTRMRRHAEGLVILSGAAPSRQWRRPVQLVDVVRAAVAEVEDYERIDIRRLPRLAVDGSAVSDLTHLAAELLENATVFSPPHTRVEVVGERVPNGFALEIHDRGLGMTPETMLEANLRLAETPEFRLSDTDRLGLFVVSRLAQRRGVRVSLQASPYGGTTAVVLVPGVLLAEGSGTQPPRAAEDGAGPAEGGGSENAPARALDGAEDPVDALFHGRGRADCPAAGEQHQRAGDGSAPDDSAEREPSGAPVPLPRRRSTPQAPRRGRPADSAADRARQQSTTAGGLPRRVRQASLVPRPEDGGPGGDSERGGPPGRDRARNRTRERDDRDAAEVRDRMASLQRGWQRGRRPGGDPPGGAGGTSGQDAPTTETTPEEDGR